MTQGVRPTPERPGRRIARLAFALVLALVALYFGDEAAEVARLPFSTLALRDLLNALLMAMMCLIFACWAVITIRVGRPPRDKEKGGAP